MLGALIGGSATYLSQRAALATQPRDELAAAVVAFGHALDHLHLRIQQLPRPTRLSRAAESLVNSRRTPHVTRLIEWGFTKSIGRDDQRAIDRFVAAYNRLTLVAPASLLEVVERLSDLLGRVEQGDKTWEEDWMAARADFLRSARTCVDT